MENIENRIEIAARLNDGAVFTNHPTHVWDAMSDRCFYCDCRPFGRHAPHPCPVR